MMAEMNLAKRFLGAKFGFGEKILDGVYAIPTTTSKGNAFMRLEMKDGEGFGKNNFTLFWDEALALDWHNTPKPEQAVESKWAKAFRALEKAGNTW